MANSFTIQLNHLRFAAPHGLFAEEALAGNEFEVNLSLTVKAPKEVLRSINDTVNYAEVFRIVKEKFAEKTPLLETLAMEIAGALKAGLPAVRKLSVQIIKLNPPIASFTGSVSVTYSQSYRE